MIRHHSCSSVPSRVITNDGGGFASDGEFLLLDRKKSNALDLEEIQGDQKVGERGEASPERLRSKEVNDVMD